jgi:4-hydroxy-4-methyl-2-oxoglutarate aldolase
MTIERNRQPMLPHSDLLQFKRWSTSPIYNGWEQITRRDIAAEGFNMEETREVMP